LADQESFIDRFKKNLVLQLGLLTVASILWFAAWLYIGQAGKCGPHDRNCETGLSSMVGFLYGLGGAFVIFVGGGVSALLAYVRRAKNQQ
jgi:hypothetical protein